MNTPSQVRKLPVNPSFEHLQKQAKRRARQSPSLPLATVQHQMAREYGCKTWAELRQRVATMSRRHDLAPQKNYEPLPKAARAGDMATVSRLLRENDFTQHDLDQSLAHALWYGDDAAWPERRALADLLLDHGADPDGQYGSGGYGPIVFGTGECLRPLALEYLIAAGADVGFAPVQTKYGLQCPLGHALGTYLRGRNGDKHRYIDILLSHGGHRPESVTPPMLAIHRGDARQLAEFLEREAGLAAQAFPTMPFGNMELRGGTLLHCAVEFGENECIDVLLRRGANINAPAAIVEGLGGQTPVFHAIATICDCNFGTLEHLARQTAQTIDMTVRATWRRLGTAQVTPLTPLEFAEQAARSDDALRRTKIAEERALLQALVAKQK